MEESNAKDNFSSSELIDYSKAMFDRHAADFDTLDNKALGVIGIAGLLVGFQALNIDTLSELMKCFLENNFEWIPLFALLALLTHGVCLIICILKALSAFQVKDFHYPDGVEILVQKAGDQKKITAEIVDAFRESAKDLERVGNEKAVKLKCSVNSITIAILALIAFMFFMVLYKCK